MTMFTINNCYYQLPVSGCRQCVWVGRISRTPSQFNQALKFNFSTFSFLQIYLFITLHLSSLQLQDVGGYYHVGPSLVSWSRFRTLLAIGFRTSFCIACRHVDVEDVEPLGCRHVLLTTGAAEVISLKISTLKLNFQLIISP